MTIKKRLEELLREGLQPERLVVTDESHLHEGHAASRPEGETHFRIAISSSEFVGKSRVEQHQMVYEAVRPLMRGEKAIHAVAIDILSS